VPKRRYIEPYLFYHSDHLGSAAYLTDENGQVTQTLNYLPYGEDWVDIQHNLDPSLIQYRSNGKEKDYESGFHYYGARYYWSELLTGWLSVDPLTDKYPSISPYAYCAWNPVRLVDPTGMSYDDPPGNLKYIIQKGDNFWNLENEWNLPHGTLQGTNPTVDPHNLHVGQEINAARVDGNYIVVGNAVHIPEGRIAETPNEEGPSGLMYVASSYDFLPFRMAFEALLPWMTCGIMEGIEGGQCFPKITSGKFCRPIQGLGNPFKNKNLTEINKVFQRYVRRGKLEPAKGCAPGNKAYVNKKSRYSYNLDPGSAKEFPHVDVNYPHGSHRVKKKLSTLGGFKND
jgi:RHS repeat-associated protein